MAEQQEMPVIAAQQPVVPAQAPQQAAQVAPAKKAAPTEVRVNMQFMTREDVYILMEGSILGSVRGAEVREGSLNAVAALVSEYLAKSRIRGVLLVATVVRH